jgi:hypothetical protein
VSHWEKIIELAVTIPVAAAAFFGALLALRVAEVQEVFELVRRKFDR